MAEQINKIWSRHTTEYYSDMKKKEILSHAKTWMNLEGIMLSEISQSQKNKFCMIPFILPRFWGSPESRGRRQNGWCQGLGGTGSCLTGTVLV